jgi:hypothetical protein
MLYGVIIPNNVTAALARVICVTHCRLGKLVATTRDASALPSLLAEAVH